MLASSELTSQILELICKKPPPHTQLQAPLCLPDNFSPTNTFVLIYPYRCATRLPYCHPWQRKLPACPFSDNKLTGTGLENTSPAPYFFVLFCFASGPAPLLCLTPKQWFLLAGDYQAATGQVVSPTLHLSRSLPLPPPQLPASGCPSSEGTTGLP